MGIPLMLVVTFGLGALNGFCISCLRVPAIVMTLGMNIILQGALVALTQGSPGQSAPPPSSDTWTEEPVWNSVSGNHLDRDDSSSNAGTL